MRDKSGKSRGERHEVSAETVAVRERELSNDGLSLRGKDALDSLAGFTLGRLLLRQRANPDDPGSIDQRQYDAGNAWCKVVHAHAAIMGYKLRIHTPSFVMVGGGQSASGDPDEGYIIGVRRQWSACYDALMAACRDHGLRVRDVAYGVCIENWPVKSLSQADYGYLRIALNALSKVLL